MMKSDQPLSASAHSTIQTQITNLCVGTDIVEVSRIQQAIEKSGKGFLTRVFTEAECATNNQTYERLAGCWAAKEAAVKALGTGFRQGIRFHDIEVIHDVLGAPHLLFTGKFAELAEQKGIRSSSLSISHTQYIAIAVVILV